MNIYYLYVKTHKITGLKYLGQTKQDAFKYSGSGIYWLNHLKKHGIEHDTVILQRCYSKSALREWGLYYSNLWAVVKSNKWANLKPESGDGGTTSEIQNRPERLEKNRQSALDMWSNEDHKKMRVEKMTNGLNQPGVQERKSTSLKKRLNTPEGKKKNLDSLVVARASDNWKEKVYDLTIYVFRHRDGRIERCTRNELIKKYGLHSGSVSGMIKGKSSISGWILDENEFNTNSGKNNGKYDHKIYSFSHVDGTIEICTQMELRIKYELSKTHLSSVVHGKRKSHKGWTILQNDDFISDKY